MTYPLWLAVIAWFIVSFIIKKTKTGKSQLTKDVIEARAKLNNTMVPVVVLYGLIWVVTMAFAQATVDYYMGHPPFNSPLAKLVSVDMLMASYFLYIVSLPLVFHFVKIGRYLIILSAILYIPKAIELIITGYVPLINKYSVGESIFLAMPVFCFIFLSFLIYFFTRPKVKEQFK